MSTNLDDFRSWAELKTIYREIEWIVPRWLPRGYVTMLAADPGVGKSLLALTVCKMILEGGAFFDGQEISRPSLVPLKRVLWVEAEAGEPFHMSRAEVLNINPLQMIEPRRTGQDFVTPSLSSAEDKATIAELMNHPDVIFGVVDSLSAATSGTDENSSQAGSHMKWLSELSRDSGKTILVIHHMNKSGIRTRGSGSPTLADIRGTSALLQHARMIWTLDNPNPEDPTQLRLSCAKSNLGAKPDSVLLSNVGGVLSGYNASVERYNAPTWYQQ